MCWTKTSLVHKWFDEFDVLFEIGCVYTNVHWRLDCANGYESGFYKALISVLTLFEKHFKMSHFFIPFLWKNNTFLFVKYYLNFRAKIETLSNFQTLCPHLWLLSIFSKRKCDFMRETDIWVTRFMKRKNRSRSGEFQERFY